MATTDLGKWMITNGGNYDPEATYEQLTMVMYDNSTYITLKTVTGVTPSNDGVNYILMAQGFDATALSAVTATDTSGLLGDSGKTVSAQSLVDYLADAVATKLLKKTDIATVQSGSTTTVPASALLKTTDDKIGDTSDLPGDAGNVVDAIVSLNSDLQGKVSKTGDTMSNTLKVEKIAGYAAGDWEMAHFLATSQNDQNENSRAGYGFNNSGVNAALLFLDTSSNVFKVRFHDGTIKTIAFTEDLQS